MASGPKFGQETVRKVADLARLQLTDQEVAKFTEQVGHILEYVEKLGQLDTSKVEPMTHAFDRPTPLREDAVWQSPGASVISACAPEQLYDNFKVPQVLGGA